MRPHREGDLTDNHSAAATDSAGASSPRSGAGVFPLNDGGSNTPSPETMAYGTRHVPTHHPTQRRPTRLQSVQRSHTTDSEEDGNSSSRITGTSTPAGKDVTSGPDSGNGVGAGAGSGAGAGAGAATAAAAGVSVPTSGSGGPVSRKLPKTTLVLRAGERFGDPTLLGPTDAGSAPRIDATATSESVTCLELSRRVRGGASSPTTPACLLYHVCARGTHSHPMCNPLPDLCIVGGPSVRRAGTRTAASCSGLGC